MWKSASGDWFSDSNWTNGVPTADDTAFMYDGGEATIDSGSAAAAKLVLGQAGGSNGGGRIVHSGGAVQFGNLEVNPTGLYRMLAGDFTATGVRLGILPGKSGTFDWIGGTLQPTTFDFNFGRLNVGFDFEMNALANGALMSGATMKSASGMQLDWVGVVNGASALQGSADVSAWIVTVDGGGSYTLNGRELLVDRHVQVGDTGAGTFVHDGGTLRTLDTVVGDVQVGGREGGTGTYDFIDGEIRLAADIVVGGRGTGEFRHRAGSASALSVLLGAQPGGDGTYRMEAGELSARYMSVGNLAATGRFLQTGGTVRLGSGQPFTLGSTTTFNGEPSAVYDLSGGSLILTEGTMELGFSGAGRFTQRGGLVQAKVVEVGVRDRTNYTRLELFGGRFEAEGIVVGNAGTVRPASGTVIQNAGDVIVSRPATDISRAMILMPNGDWRQSGGTVTADIVQLTHLDNTTASWLITGGSLTARDMRVGWHESLDHVARLSIGGTGSVDVANLRVGNAHGTGRGELRLDDTRAMLRVSESLRFGPTAVFTSVPTTSIRLAAGASVGNESTNAANMAGLGSVAFVFREAPADKVSTVEAAGRDAGGGAAGYVNNFAVRGLLIGGQQPAQVRLVDEHDNQPTLTGAEAFYAGEILISPGSRLDTNGLKLYTGHLSLGGDASVDVRHGELVVVVSDPQSRAMRLAQLESWVRRGRDGGPDAGGIVTTATDGRGITGLAVGAVPGTDERELLVKYTYNGDANVDGVVNADDYFRIDSGYIAAQCSVDCEMYFGHQGGYAWGDFNYDGKVNADDYFLIDSAFLGQTGVLGVGVGAVAAVPEPAGIIGLLLGAGLLLRRRKH